MCVSFLPSDCIWWKSVVVHVCPHMCACAPCFFAQMWKTLFVRRLVTPKGRLYKIPACWSNGTVGKATIVVVTMKRLSSMTLREKSTQFVFCPSLLLSHSQACAHTFFPSALLYPFNLSLLLHCSPAHTFFCCFLLSLSRHQLTNSAALPVTSANAYGRRRLYHLRCRRHRFLLQLATFATMLTQSVTLWPTGVLRVTGRIFDQMSLGWKQVAQAWNNLERQRMALIILSLCWKGQRMRKTGYSRKLLALWLFE